MRCLLKVAIPVETGNAAISDGSLPKTIESILADIKRYDAATKLSM
jgi:hypothetical protein